MCLNAKISTVKYILVSGQVPQNSTYGEWALNIRTEQLAVSKNCTLEIVFTAGGTFHPSEIQYKAEKHLEITLCSWSWMHCMHSQSARHNRKFFFFPSKHTSSLPPSNFSYLYSSLCNQMTWELAWRTIIEKMSVSRCAGGCKSYLVVWILPNKIWLTVLVS